MPSTLHEIKTKHRRITPMNKKLFALILAGLLVASMDA